MCSFFLCDGNCKKCAGETKSFNNGYYFVNSKGSGVVVCKTAFKKYVGERLDVPNELQDKNQLSLLREKAKQAFISNNTKQLGKIEALCDTLELNFSFAEIVAEVAREQEREKSAICLYLATLRSTDFQLRIGAN